MYDCFITFRSITGAQLGSALLHNAGIYHQLVRTPKPLSEKGCGYTIRVKSATLSRSVAVLGQGGAPYQQVVRLEQTGEWEVLTI